MPMACSDWFLEQKCTRQIQRDGVDEVIEPLLSNIFCRAAPPRVDRVAPAPRITPQSIWFQNPGFLAIAYSEYNLEHNFSDDSLSAAHIQRSRRNGFATRARPRRPLHTRQSSSKLAHMRAHVAGPHKLTGCIGHTRKGTLKTSPNHVPMLKPCHFTPRRRPFADSSTRSSRSSSRPGR